MANIIPADGYFHLGRDFGLDTSKGKLTVAQVYGSLANAIDPNNPANLGQWYRRWKEGLKRSDADFLKVSFPVAAANEACWRGHDQQFFDIGTASGNTHYCFSRVPIIWPWGEYWLNCNLEIPCADWLGAGTSACYKFHRGSTQFFEWNEENGGVWLGFIDGPIVRFVNWGLDSNEGYHEGPLVDKFRFTGTNKGPWNGKNKRSAWGFWKGGETSKVGRLYTEYSNWHCYEAGGGTPLEIENISGFNSAGAILAITGGALSTGKAKVISGDDCVAAVYMEKATGHEAGGEWDFGLIKNETAITDEARGTWKGMIPLWLVGSFGVTVRNIWAPCSYGRLSAPIVVDPRTVDGIQASSLSVGKLAGYNHNAFLHDIARGKEFYGHANFQRVTAIEYLGQDGSLTCKGATMQQRAVAGTKRLGFARTGVAYEPQLGKPVFSMWDGNTPTLPPTPVPTPEPEPTPTPTPTPTPGTKTAPQTLAGFTNATPGGTTPVDVTNVRKATVKGLKWSAVSGPQSYPILMCLDINGTAARVQLKPDGTVIGPAGMTASPAKLTKGATAAATLTLGFASPVTVKSLLNTTGTWDAFQGSATSLELT